MAAHVRRVAAHVEAGDLRGAGGRTQLRREDLQERALAGAVDAQHAEEFATADRQRHVIEHDQLRCTSGRASCRVDPS